MAAKKQPLGPVSRPGALTRKAKAAHESIAQFAEEHQNTPGLTGQQSRYYENILKKKKK